MTIHLNLTPKEAKWLHQQTAGLQGVALGISKKLMSQASKFAFVTQAPVELKLPGTGNVNLVQPNLAHSLIDARTAVLAGRDPNYNKIPVIKAIREVVGCQALGLSDAKWASENWPAFIDFVERNGRLPEPGFAYQPMR